MDENYSHTAKFVTPTGGQYRSGAPPLLRAPVRMEISEMEVAVGIAISDLHAA
jgi:hypothetical protein